MSAHDEGGVDSAAYYLAALTARLGTLATEQAGAIEHAASTLATAIAARRMVHLYDSGHMIGFEFVARTGGLLAFRRLSKPSLSEPADDRYPAAGDVVVVSSVSGVSPPLVELALDARRRGLPVIAVTGVQFSTRLPAKHPSGQRLLEVADVVLDNLAPYGDAFHTVPGFAAQVCPISGVAGAALLWAVVAATVQRLVENGIAPSVYPSVNLPDGPTVVAAVEQRYREKGY